MRRAVAGMMVAFSGSLVHACWERPWNGGPVYYYPVTYVAPLSVMPLVECCPCGPMMPATRVVPPVAMPEKAPPPKGLSSETPYSPIVPASSQEPMTPLIPKTDLEVRPQQVRPLPQGEKQPLLPVSPEPTPPKLAVPEMPKLELPKIESQSPGAAPRLELPPLPKLEVKKVTSNFRPPQPTLVPVEGAASLDGKYRVGFFNFSEREVRLTVNGQAITLPARSSITATVEQRFRWAADGGESTSTDLSGAGAEVILR